MKSLSLQESIRHETLFMRFQPTGLCRLAKHACHCTMQCSEEMQGQFGARCFSSSQAVLERGGATTLQKILLFLGARRRDVAEQMAPTKESKVCLVQIACGSRSSTPGACHVPANQATALARSGLKPLRCLDGRVMLGRKVARPSMAQPPSKAALKTLPSCWGTRLCRAANVSSSCFAALKTAAHAIAGIVASLQPLS
ncbi:unnamed protein product [Effrenium voratum]|uniref:Uncharacterized protein n=1 Tax=Effrenium voratum TaxID=2562239 RepID=A0AA36MSC4_9DINO|nr:unnamed protein product [Effrenium voratum]